MKLYRAMCKEEFKGRCAKHPFSFSKGKFKWFSDNLDFVTNRVKDGKFNNSKFKKDAYNVLVEYVVDDISCFKRVSNNELMLSVRDVNKVKVFEINVLENF